MLIFSPAVIINSAINRLINPRKAGLIFQVLRGEQGKKKHKQGENLIDTCGNTGT